MGAAASINKTNDLSTLSSDDIGQHLTFVGEKIEEYKKNVMEKGINGTMISNLDNLDDIKVTMKSIGIESLEHQDFFLAVLKKESQTESLARTVDETQKKESDNQVDSTNDVIKDSSVGEEVIPAVIVVENSDDAGGGGGADDSVTVESEIIISEEVGEPIKDPLADDLATLSAIASVNSDASDDIKAGADAGANVGVEAGASAEVAIALPN